MATDRAREASGYRQLDHTADVALEIWAPDEAALLSTGARAVIAILTDGAAVAAEARRRVTIDAVDAEDRLVQWLNEILVAAMVDGFLFAAARLELDDATLCAEILGQEDQGDRIVTELKSVTYHDLALELSPGEARCRVVIDV